MNANRLAVVVLFIVSCAHAQSPDAWLERARNAMGFSRVAGGVLHYHALYADQQNYQSERTYPPFFDAMVTTDNWFSPQTGVLRTASQMTYPGGSPPGSVSLFDTERGVTIRNDKAIPIARSSLRLRDLDAWAVVYDWSHAAGVRLAGREVYRDYPRVVLARNTSAGEQRLFLDPKTGFPVKLDYTEPHYLWGKRHIEYLYSLWQLQDGVLVNSAAFRLADGEVEISSTTGDAAVVPTNVAASLPSLQMPPPSAASPDLPLFLQPLPPQTIPVGPSTYLLKNPGYAEAVTLAGNEIYVFDATQGEERARQDEAIIRKLFPGNHKINVVVTDLAWPHVAGVRYWVAQGATIISHAISRPFLDQVVNRRWTLHPDTLEQRRKTAKLHFLAIDSAQQLAGGKVRLAPIDGIGSEGALMAFLPADNFLWASDYFQDATQPTEYAQEVFDAVRRLGWQPRRVAAEHVDLTPWDAVTKLAHNPQP